MKVLVAVDSSRCTDHAVLEVGRRQWPPDTEIEIVSVAHTRVPFLPDPVGVMTALYETAIEDARHDAAAQVTRVRDYLSQVLAETPITTTVLEGAPAKQIVGEAQRWHADLIVVGAHDRGRVGRLLRGSVSRGVSKRAPCPVDVVGPTHWPGGLPASPV